MLLKTSDKGSNILPKEIYLFIEVLVTQGYFFPPSKGQHTGWNKARYKFRGKKTATTYSL